MQTPHQFDQLLKFGREPLAILPAAIVQVASRAARLWCLVRSIDHPDNGGNGSGIVQISIEEIRHWLQRSERSVWRYIKESLSKGYLHSCHCEDGQLRIEYRGLRSLAKHLGLGKLGAIGEFPLSELQHARAYAADITAERRQAQSMHQMRREHKQASKGAKKANELLASSPSAKVPGGDIIAKGNRLLYLGPSCLPFGTSLEGIARELGCSTRTAQYRLSNAWREERGITPIEKRQGAYQILEDCPKEFFNEIRALEDKPWQYVQLGRRVFKLHTNLYASSVLLRGARYRQSEYKRHLEACYNLERGQLGTSVCTTPSIDEGLRSPFVSYADP